MKEAVIFGAGNIGRGFIGQLFCESGYRVTFVDVDAELVAGLNRQGTYPLETVFNDERQEYRIGPVTALHGAQQAAAAVEAVTRAELGATAVGAGALKFIMPNLVAGLERRAATQAGPFNLIICENLKGAAAIVRKMVEDKAAPAALPYIREQVGFIDTVIGRMVPLPTPEMRARDVTLIRVEPYKELPVDRAGFAGPVPTVSAMKAYDNFSVFTARKLYLHNCGHALLAYAGWLRQHEFGWQALADSRVRRILEGGLAESLNGIVAKYGAERHWLEEHVADLLRRFSNQALGDTVFRLGRDPVRKLQPADRLIGSARLAESTGQIPQFLALGIAAAFAFIPAEDPVAVELHKKIAVAGLPAVLAEVCGIQAGEPLGRQILSSYEALALLRL